MAIRTDEFNKIVAAYPHMKTEQARAIAEARLWNMASPEERTKVPKRGSAYWLRDLLGAHISLFSLENRAMLFNASLPQSFWERLDQGMPIGTAARLVRDAKKQVRKEGASFGLALDQTLADYEKASCEVRTASGGVFRKRKQADQFRTPVDAKHTKLADSADAPSWKQLRHCIRQIVASRALDVSEIGQIELCGRLEADIKTAIEAFTARAAALRTSTPSEVSRRQVLDACRILQMPPPKPGALVDLTVARRQKRRFARLIHSDAGGTGDGEDMRLIVESFDVLERFNQKGSIHVQENL